MPGEKKQKIAKIRFEVEERIPNVFGEFGGILGISLGLEFEGDANNFEKEIDFFQERMVKKIRSSAKEIAALSGVSIPGEKG